MLLFFKPFFCVYVYVFLCSIGNCGINDCVQLLQFMFVYCVWVRVFVSHPHFFCFQVNIACGRLGGTSLTKHPTSSLFRLYVLPLFNNQLLVLYLETNMLAYYWFFSSFFFSLFAVFQHKCQHQFSTMEIIFC